GVPAGAPDLGAFAAANPAFAVAGHKVGDTGVTGVLAANTSGWPVGATFTYQWTRDGQKIDGATAASYALTAADSGTDVGVVIWGAVDGVTAWEWGEVGVGTITGNPADQTTPGTTTPGTTTPGTPPDQSKPLAATGTTALLVLAAALALLAGGAGVLLVRRLRSVS
ncbi:MAG: hypothetical protein FWE61_07690, partial [Micrococcales bacterium]|nr:hypothetical protein [Micrococcales bacterium]